MTARNFADIGKRLEAASARLDHAERALAGVNGEIHSTRAIITGLRGRLAETPHHSGDASDASFAETRRSALRHERARLTATLEVLVAEQMSRRREVGRLLRQKSSLEATLEGADVERRRLRANR